MKKLIVTVLFMCICAVAYGSVAVDDIDGYVGEATNIKVEGQEATFDGSKVTILSSGHKEGVTANVSTESNLISAALAYGVIDMRAGSAKSIALANGVPGQMITIVLTTYDQKTVTITDDQVSPAVFPMTKTGWDDILLNSSLDSVTLLYFDDTYGWIIIANNGATVT